MKISIVLPIYNVEKYLYKSIESIGLFNQEQVEIILVNDGSTDGSLDICRCFAHKFSNVSIINKSNGGLSDARNAGINAAKGEYIYFLDSDDWLVSNAIMTLYDFAIKNKCEVVQAGFYYAYPNYLLFDDRYICEETHPFVLNKEETMRELIKNTYIKNFVWGKLYKTSIVKRHLNPVGKYFEDAYWQHLIINEISCYGIIPQPLYYYRQRGDSISGHFSLKNIDLLEGYKERYYFIRDNYPQFESLMRHCFFNLVRDMYLASLSSKDKRIINAFIEYISKIDTSKAPLSLKIDFKYPTLLKIISLMRRTTNRILLKNKPLKRINI